MARILYIIIIIKPIIFKYITIIFFMNAKNIMFNLTYYGKSYEIQIYAELI